MTINHFIITETNKKTGRGDPFGCDVIRRKGTGRFFWLAVFFIISGRVKREIYEVDAKTLLTWVAPPTNTRPNC